MNNFKPGDAVYLPEHWSSGHINSSETFIGRIPLDTKLIVDDVIKDLVKLVGYSLYYPSNIFKPLKLAGGHNVYYPSSILIKTNKMKDLEFPFKVGDQIKVIKLILWSHMACDIYPIDTVRPGDIINITKVKDRILGDKYISFAGTVNGIEYGFSYCKENEYELYKKSIMEKITRTDYLKIYEIACLTWKSKLEEMYGEIFKTPFDEDGEISKERIEEMFKAATSVQKPILEDIFKDYIKNVDKNIFKKLDDKVVSNFFNNMVRPGCTDSIGVCCDSAPKNRPDLSKRSLYVTNGYQVYLIPPKEGYNGTIIEIVKK